MTTEEIIEEMMNAYESTLPDSGGYPAMGERLMAAMKVLAGHVADEKPKKKRVVKK